MERVTVICRLHGPQEIPADMICVLDFAGSVTISVPCGECSSLFVAPVSRWLANELVVKGASWTAEGSVLLASEPASEPREVSWIRQVIDKINGEGNGT